MLPPGILWEQATETLLGESLEALCEGQAYPTFLIAKLQAAESAAEPAGGGERRGCEVRSVLDVRTTKDGGVLFRPRDQLPPPTSVRFILGAAVLSRRFRTGVGHVQRPREPTPTPVLGVPSVMPLSLC